MPVRLRLARHGARNAPFYHLVAIRDSAPRDARPIEKLGEYDPVPRLRSALGASASSSSAASSSSSHARGADGVFTSGLPRPEQLVKEKRIEWNSERIRYWLGVGAQPSKPVARLLDRVSGSCYAAVRVRQAEEQGTVLPLSALSALDGQVPGLASAVADVAAATKHSHGRLTHTWLTRAPTGRPDPAGQVLQRHARASARSARGC
jgi:small subunit ribosomal protein S16